jgi:diaminohydroxyphosphoribosylaminopyrimidine deaminase/5-amino-6-(5-phosphoribosylamino)uracil reductase
MQRCLELAERGRGHTGVNPLVGAVLVRESTVLAEGWHTAFGQDHAERMLIKKFDQEILPKDILYVNLEPCCHYGNTPPCTDILIESGIQNIVYGMQDPNSAVAGQGISLLREKGLSVAGPVLPEACRRLNKGFVSLQELGRPYITLKKAQTLTGEIAQQDGSLLKITSTEQDVWSHTHLRAKHDAILVGIQTITSDDPQLTVRSKNKKLEQTLAQPLRLILNSALSISLDAKVVNGELAAGTLLIASSDAESENEEELLSRGVQILRIPMKDGVFDWQILWAVLTTPHDNFYGVSSILVEGGQKTWDSFKTSGYVDEEVLLVDNSS